MIGWALHQKGIIHIPSKLVDGVPLMENGVEVIDGDRVFPTLVTALLPTGIRGLIVACLLAALMSSLASLFNSSATLFTIDFYERLRPGRSQKHYLRVGRVATTVVVLLGIAWVPVIPLLGESLYEALQKVQALIAPSIVAVFFLGIFTNRITPAAGFWGLVLGFLAGMFYLVLDLSPALAASNPFFAAIQGMNWLYYCCALLIFSVLVMFVVSFFSQTKSDAELAGLTYHAVTPEQLREVRESWGTWDVVNTVVIIGIIVFCYISFF
jgi:SSS family solute:Na+ symporter